MKRMRNPLTLPTGAKGRRYRRLARLIAAGLLFAWSGAVWTPPVLADNETVMITTQTELTNDAHYNTNSLILSGSGNQLTIQSSPSDPVNVQGSVAAGDIFMGNAEANRLVITGGTFHDSVVGGGSGVGSANRNEVTISGGAFHCFVYGGLGGANTDGNRVTITDGTFDLPVFGGNSFDGNADGNTVTVEGGTFAGTVFGGSSGTGSADNNTVRLSGGNINNNVFGGQSNSGNANGNTLEITAGSVGSTVFGGYSSSGSADGNSVTISGGRLYSAVYGGYSGSGEANNNTVVLNPQGSMDIGNTLLFGSNQSNASGNTLKVYGKGLTAGNIANFSNLYFYLPGTIAGGDVVLTLTNGGTDIAGSTVKAGIAGNASVADGDTITLLTNANGITTTGVTYGTLTEGVSLEHSLNIAASADGKSLVATVAPGALNSQTQSLVETRASSSAFLDSGADLLSGQGLNNATAAAAQAAGFTPFATLGGQTMRYKTGSYVDNKGYSLGIGMARTMGTQAGTLTIAPFLEGGWGRYDSYLDSGVHGDGQNRYYGAGVLARQERSDGSYYEGSLRYGRLTSDYSSNDLSGSSHTGYETRTPYYGLHFGVGKVMHKSDKATLDAYGKYYYSHQNDATAQLSSGETYQFDSVNSHRIRVGARYSQPYGPEKRSCAYVGAAYEYEFDGDAQAIYKGYSTLTPSLRGGSGLLEAGCQLVPGTGPLTVQMGVTGWAGKKQGVDVNANVQWTF